MVSQPIVGGGGVKLVETKYQIWLILYGSPKYFAIFWTQTSPLLLPSGDLR